MQSVVLVGQSAISSSNNVAGGYSGMTTPGQSFFMGGDISSKTYHHQISPRNSNNHRMNEGLNQYAGQNINNEGIGSTSLGNIGQYSFKGGKRTGINQSSSLQNNQQSTPSQFTLLGPQTMFQVQQTQNFAFISNEKLNSVYQ